MQSYCVSLFCNLRKNAWKNSKPLFNTTKNYTKSILYYFSARIPVASQVTALEIWLLACILLVFGALAEYAFILRQVIKLSRQQQRMRNHFNLQLKNNPDVNNPQTPPAQLDVFSPNAGKILIEINVHSLVFI